MAKQVLAANGVPQARYRAFREHEITPGLPQQLADEFGLPLFVKPANMGSSVGVSKAKTVEAVRDAIVAALTYDEWVVVEEAIVGREIEVAVLGNLEPRASLPGEIVPGAEFYDYADKYLDDGSQCLIPAPLSAEATAEVQRLAVHVFRLLRCDGMARVDFFYEDGPTGAASCATRSTRSPGSRRSRCTRRCGSPAGCRTQSSSTSWCGSGSSATRAVAATPATDRPHAKVASTTPAPTETNDNVTPTPASSGPPSARPAGRSPSLIEPTTPNTRPCTSAGTMR